MHGSENAMSYSNVITGAAFTVEHVQHKFITKDMLNGTLEGNLYHGSSQAASPAMTHGIIKIYSQNTMAYFSCN